MRELRFSGFFLFCKKGGNSNGFIYDWSKIWLGSRRNSRYKTNCFYVDQTLLAAYEAGKAANKATWADIYIPGFGSYFVKFEPGEIPMPDLETNNKLDIQISNVINSYEGLGDEIEPTIA